MTPENRQVILETLCTLLTNSTDSTIRIRAAQSLGRLSAESSIPLLCQLAVQDQDTDVRLAIMDALVAIAQSQSTNPMPEPSKNQPTFHINQVGNINTGDVTIQGNQIGEQHNHTASKDDRTSPPS